MNRLPLSGLPPGLAEATNLTRAGRLGEATALLQRALRGAAPDHNQDKARPDAAPHASLRQRLTEGLAQGLNQKLGRGRVSPAEEPAHLPQGARFLRGHHAAPGAGPAAGRDYRLYIPASHEGGPAPLLVMLHGCTQTPEDFAIGTKMNALAESQGFLVAYPAQSASANMQRCWNWFNAEDQQREGGEAGLLAAMVRQIVSEQPVDPRRVYAAGLSAGGAAAAILGATHPDLFAAIGVHSGLACGAARDMPSAFSVMRQGSAGARRPGTGAVPTIVFHADRDGTVHPVNGDQVLAQSAAGLAGGAALRQRVSQGQVPGGHAYTQTRHEDAGGRARLEQWVVHGGGHAWSGGDAAGSYTDPRGPDASAAMLRFFAENPRLVS